MGFLSGSVTFERYRITDDPTGLFGEEHIGELSNRKINSRGKNLLETPCTGFVGGAHLFDTKFSIEKNVIGEALHFGIRFDSCQIPGPIKQAWMHMELAGIMPDDQSGRPSKAQREEAKEAVEALCVAEAKKGNYMKMAVTPVLWDSKSETLFLGSSSEKSNDACLSLLNETFGLEFSRVTSGKLALEFAESTERTEAVYDATPSTFSPEGGGSVVWWNGMQDNYDYLGNEFLLWLWWNWETNGELIELSDGTEVTGMFARSLNLDCPQGENGKESISSDSPVALPEAMLAIQMGKLPRKAGLTLVRNNEQFDLNLQAELFTVGSARISQIGGDANSRELSDRIESVRNLSETLDLLFDVFCDVRFGKSWNSNFKRISEWLAKPGNRRKSRAA